MMQTVVKNSVKVKTRTPSRCDYIVRFEGANYYVWGKTYGDASVGIHILDTHIEPGFAIQQKVLKFLRSDQGDDPCYRQCFN